MVKIFQKIVPAGLMDKAVALVLTASYVKPQLMQLQEHALSLQRTPPVRQLVLVLRQTWFATILNQKPTSREESVVMTLTQTAQMWAACEMETIHKEIGSA